MNSTRDVPDIQAHLPTGRGLKPLLSVATTPIVNLSRPPAHGLVSRNSTSKEPSRQPKENALAKSLMFHGMSLSLILSDDDVLQGMGKLLIIRAVEETVQGDMAATSPTWTIMTCRSSCL